MNDRANRSTVYDVAIVGGGINGCGIARDAAGRGAKVLLLESGDLAGGTSSASSKLIHGGLRYLEHYEFGLVRESLAERERLWTIAPHLIRPMRFVLPHVRGLRPRWLLRLGLFLYDHIGGRDALPATQSVRLAQHPAGSALKTMFSRAFVYSDCWADDSRLVVLNARDAANRGAHVHTRCRVTGLVRESGLWRITAGQRSFHARTVVNAAGPGVLGVLEAGGIAYERQIRLVRGSHIVVPQLFAHDCAYFFQLPDGRIFFAIPYEEDFTLIGTTDVEHLGSADRVKPSEEEIAYICNGANLFFKRSIAPTDVVWSYAGVRPLLDDGAAKPEAATRGYRLALSPPSEGAPLLNVFGGKLTVYRHLAEEAVDLLAPHIDLESEHHWTDCEPLPGGDFPRDSIARLINEIADAYPFFDQRTVRRLARSYGDLCFAIFGKVESLSACGHCFGHGLTQCEVDYLLAEEWAVDADDILWRRSKLGLRFTPPQVQQLRIFLKERKVA